MKRGGCHTNTLTGSKYETFMAIYKTYAIQSSAKRKMSMQKDPEIRDVVSCMKLLSSFTCAYKPVRLMQKTKEEHLILKWWPNFHFRGNCIFKTGEKLENTCEPSVFTNAVWHPNPQCVQSCSHLTWLRSFSLSARDVLHVMWRIYDLWCSLFLSASTLHLHNCGNNCAWERTTHILFRKYSTVYSLFDLVLHFHFSLIFCLSFVMCILAF